MIILDTNVLSALMATEADADISKWTRQNTEPFYTTVISEAEIFYGIERLPEGKKKTGLRETAELLFRETIAGRVLGFSNRTARIYASLLAKCHKAGHNIEAHDAQIAAIALAHGATLATRNIRDFKGCGIDAVNPWQAA